MGIGKYLKMNFLEIFEKIKFGRIISRNSLKIIEKYFGLFWKIFLIKSFRKNSKIILENFGKLQKYFWKFQEILTKFLKIILKKFL